MEQYHILNNLKNVQVSHLQVYYPDVTWAFMAHCFPVTKQKCNLQRNIQVQYAINTIKKNYRCRRNSKLKTLCNLSYKIEFNVLLEDKHSNNATDSFITLFRKKN